MRGRRIARPRGRRRSALRVLASRLHHTDVWRQQAAQRAAIRELEKRVDFGLPDPCSGQRRCTTRMAEAKPEDEPTLIGGYTVTPLKSLYFRQAKQKPPRPLKYLSVP